MKQFEDDDFEIPPAVPPPPPAPVNAPVTPTAAPANGKAASTALTDTPAPIPTRTGSPAYTEDDEVCDFGDPEASRVGDGYDRIRPDKSQPDLVVRFALMPHLKPRKALVHWVEGALGKSQRRCASKPRELPAYCCQVLGESRYHVVVPAIQYLNCSTTGAYAKDYTGPVEFKLGFVDLSPSTFSAVGGLVEDDGTNNIYQVDVTMKRNGQKFDFAMRKCVWRNRPEVAQAVESAMQRFVATGGEQKLHKKLGRETTLKEWRELLAGQVAKAESVTLDDDEY